MLHDIAILNIAVSALPIGVAFQYAARASMSDRPRSKVLWPPFKFDVLSQYLRGFNLRYGAAARTDAVTVAVWD